MIATAHGTHVIVIGTGSGSSSIDRLKSLLMKLEREVSIEVLIQQLDEMTLTRQYDIPLSVIRLVKQSYLKKIRECWFVPIDLTIKNLTYKLSHLTRKNPDSTDRRVNKRKTFLKSLIN